MGYQVNKLIFLKKKLIFFFHFVFSSICKAQVTIFNYAQTCCKADIPDEKDATDKPSICYFKCLYIKKLKLHNAQFTHSQIPYTCMICIPFFFLRKISKIYKCIIIPSLTFCKLTRSLLYNTWMYILSTATCTHKMTLGTPSRTL